MGEYLEDTKFYDHIADILSAESHRRKTTETNYDGLHEIKFLMDT